MKFDMRGSLPKKVKVLELLPRDGFQHSRKFIPTETKVWFIDQIVKAGYKHIEVTNFGHPKILIQARDAEEVLKRTCELESVKKSGVRLKCYGMTQTAFERAADCKQKGFGPHSVAFTISAEDLHGRRNSGRTREEYLKEIPGFVKVAQENGFDIDMAIACTFGSVCAGPVPIENTIELMERGLDMGIRNFTPCDTTGEGNPLIVYEHMSALIDKFSKYDDQINYKVAHFHDARGMGLACYVAALMAGADIVETSLGQQGGQPSFLCDDIVGVGSGPLYSNHELVGNSSTEDVLVMLDEMGIDTGVDVDKMLQLGRVLEWVYEQPLRTYCTRAGRPIKQPVEWCIPTSSLAYIPPYGEKTDGNWAFPEKYKPASAGFIAKEFEGLELRWDPWEAKVKAVKEDKE